MKAFDKKDFESHKAEVQERWGNTEAYQEHQQKTKNYSKDKWNSLAEDMDLLMVRFAQCMTSGASPLSPEAQSLVEQLQSHITDNYYLCTKEILFGLGQMYVADDRFRTNIDTHSPGTAEFIQEAITAYCNNTESVPSC